MPPMHSLSLGGRGSGRGENIVIFRGRVPLPPDMEPGKGISYATGASLSPGGEGQNEGKLTQNVSPLLAITALYQ